jgi:hypothetical protein
MNEDDPLVGERAASYSAICLVDPVSDFEPIKDTADTGPTITVEPQDHNQARLAAMLAQSKADKMVRWSREGIIL